MVRACFCRPTNYNATERLLTRPFLRPIYVWQEGTEAAARKVEKGDKILEIEGVAVKVCIGRMWGL